VPINSNTSEDARHRSALRAWQLALLRFAVTRDNADRLASFSIAVELDAPGPWTPARSGFSFFRQASNKLCHAMLDPQHESNRVTLQQHLDRMDDEHLKHALAAALGVDAPRAGSVTASAKARRDLWRGLTPRNRKRA
jgi:hypothetical protein